MILLALVCVRWNPQLGGTLVFRNQTREQGRTTLSSKDENIIVVPENIDGIANTTLDDHYGVNIHIPGSTRVLWAQDIFGDYICGVEKGGFHFTNEVSYTTTTEPDPLGVFIVFLIGICICSVVTASWPILLSLTNTVGSIDRKMDTALSTLGDIKSGIYTLGRILAPWKNWDTDTDTENHKESTKCLDVFKYVWMCISFMCLLFISIIVSQVMCVNLGWRNMRAAVVTDKCYFIDKTHLSLNQKNQTITERLSLDSDDQEITTQATVTYNENTRKATFVSSCGATFVNMSNGAIWKVRPQYGYNCEHIPAIRIRNIKSSTVSVCGWTQQWPEYSRAEMEEGDDRVDVLEWNSQVKIPEVDIDGRYLWMQKLTDYRRSMVTGFWTPGVIMFRDGWTSKVNRDSCGFLGLATRYKRALISTSLINNTKWEKCVPFDRGSVQVVRIDPQTGEELEVKGTTDNIEVSDVYTRMLGWYTDGQSVIINNAVFDNGTGTSMFFGDRAERDYVLDTIRNMIDFHSTSWTVRKPRDIETDPASFACKVMFTLPDADKFEEFAVPCSSVSSEINEDGQIFIRTDSEGYCTVKLGYEDGVVTTFSIKHDSPATVFGVKTWDCKTVSNSTGINCGGSTQNEFIPTYDDGIIRTVTNSTTDNTGVPAAQRGGLLEGWSLSSLLGGSTIIDILIDILSLVIICLVIYGIIKLVLFLVARLKTKKKSEDTCDV